MKPTWILLTLLLSCALRTFGAMSPAPELLPADTVGFLTAPDWSKAKNAWLASNLGKLWGDPGMRPFRTKFEQRFGEEISGHLEKQLGINASELIALARGQVTFAFFRRGGPGAGVAGGPPPWVVLIDTGDQANAAKSWVDKASKLMRSRNRTLKTTRIRDVDFQTLILTPAEFSELTKGSFDAPDAEPEDDDDDDKPKDKPQSGKAQPKSIEVLFGVTGNSLLIGTHAGSLEPILSRLKGGDSPVLAGQERYQSAAKSVLKGGQIQGWVDMAPLTSAAQASLGGSLGMLGADPSRLLTALGLDAVRWAGFQLMETPEGTSFHGALAVPEAQRTGLTKAIQAEAKDSGPPGFIPRDAIRFQRWRLNGPRTWQTLEDALNKVSPQLVGIFKLALESAAQQEDPNFSFKTEFIDRLGDDFVTFEKPAKGKTLPELNNPPSLMLLGSPKSERLVNGLRAIMIMGQSQSRNPGVQVREFLGRKIYSARMTVPGGGNTGGQIHMAAGTDYVAISSDVAMVEEYLRTTGDAPKSLREFPGLAAAAEKVGGFSTGIFVFENQLEASRSSWELMRKGGSLDKLMPPGTANLSTAKLIADWADFSLLPEFDTIAKYFTFGVLASSNDSQTLGLKWFAPAAR